MNGIARRALLCAALQLTLSACGGSDDASDPFASEGSYVQNVSTTAATIGVLTTKEQVFAGECETIGVGSGVSNAWSCGVTVGIESGPTSFCGAAGGDTGGCGTWDGGAGS